MVWGKVCPTLVFSPCPLNSIALPDLVIIMSTTPKSILTDSGTLALGLPTICMVSSGVFLLVLTAPAGGYSRVIGFACCQGGGIYFQNIPCRQAIEPAGILYRFSPSLVTKIGGGAGVSASGFGGGLGTGGDGDGDGAGAGLGDGDTSDLGTKYCDGFADGLGTTLGTVLGNGDTLALTGFDTVRLYLCRVGKLGSALDGTLLATEYTFMGFDITWARLGDLATEAANELGMWMLTVGTALGETLALLG